jgi:Delta7-sterol 5-desaturase
MEVIIQSLQSWSLAWLFVLFLVENLVILTLVIVVGHLIIKLFEHRRVCQSPPKLAFWECSLALVNVFLNSCITILGLWLWRQGIINFRLDFGIYAILDIAVLLFAMDFLMYWLHRIVHYAPLYFIHKTHHDFERVRPLTLFVLSPFESLGFGFLWLILITVYDASWLGMSSYLVLNVAFGAVGHLGVEPCPRTWPKWRGLKYISTSTFHAQHHRDIDHNFGFYTLIWDRLFGTLSKLYDAEFGRLPVETTPLTNS